MRRRQDALILAFYPHARGFSYVVCEGPLSLIDWGMSDIPAKRKSRVCLRRLSALIDRYDPDAVVTRRLPEGRFAGLSEAIVELVESRGVIGQIFSRNEIREAFAPLGLATRYAIAETIAKQIPVLAAYTPPVRKIWFGEDRRMGLFDAAAMALTFYENNGQR
jgi:hypothetical protein